MSRWLTPSGKVHEKRERFYVGTKDERPARRSELIMLCGEKPHLTQVPDDTTVTCGTCVGALHKNGGGQ